MRIEFQLEEPSAEAVLKLVLPPILRDRAAFRIIDYRSKDRMLRELPKRFKGYQRAAFGLSEAFADSRSKGGLS